MNSNKLPSYQECLQNCQCVLYYDYIFTIESRRGFWISIFENENLIIEEPISNEEDYKLICDYWYDITKNAKNEQEARKEKLEYMI